MSVQLPDWSEYMNAPYAPDGHRVRHRVLYGGRGGAKSWTIALMIVLRARVAPLRILCVREYQNSIRDSSKLLLENSIERLGLGIHGDRFFKSTEREIRGRNGSVITFLGLNGKEASIKSLEGVDIVWVEEASTITQASIDALIPTIRREGSELWWSYNPRYPTDPVDKMFRGAAPPPGTIMQEVCWRDNPWFPEVLARDMEYDLGRDPEKHAHIWMGGYVRRSDAQIFKDWRIAAFEAPADAEFRMGADWGYSIDPTVLVRCFIGEWAGEPGNSEVVANPKGRCLFIDYEAYMVGCALDHTPALFAGSDTRPRPLWINPLGFQGIPGAARLKIIADSSRPDTIDFLKRRGFKIEGAAKGSRSIEEGITFLQSFDIVVHPRCKHLQDELLHYSWAMDRLTGEYLSKPADTRNHVIDALRYALEGARRARGGDFPLASAGRRLSLSAYGGLVRPYHPKDHQGGGRGWGSSPGLSRGLSDPSR